MSESALSPALEGPKVAGYRVTVQTSPHAPEVVVIKLIDPAPPNRKMRRELSGTSAFERAEKALEIAMEKCFPNAICNLSSFAFSIAKTNPHAVLAELDAVAPNLLDKEAVDKILGEAQAEKAKKIEIEKTLKTTLGVLFGSKRGAKHRLTGDELKALRELHGDISVILGANAR